MDLINLGVLNQKSVLNVVIYCNLEDMLLTVLNIKNLMNAMNAEVVRGINLGVLNLIKIKKGIKYVL